MSTGQKAGGASGHVAGITLAEAAGSADGLGELQATPAGVLWLAVDSASGRKTLWHFSDGDLPQGKPRRLTSARRDIGSRVNGYGGGAHVWLDGAVIMLDAPSQRLLSQSLDGGVAHHWWSRPDASYGGLAADPHRRRVLAVEELGDGRQGTQRLVALRKGHCETLVEGADFYGAPALSKDGGRLAWVEWELPHMPWQRSRLGIAELDADGHVRSRRYWDGGAAVTQPCFAADGSLIVMSDHGGWWQPYRLEGETAHLLSEWPADHAPTPWQLGECHHLWFDDGGIVVRIEDGAAQVLHVDFQGHTLARYFPDAARVSGLASADGWLYAITQGVAHASRLERVRLGGENHETLFALDMPNAAASQAPIPETLTVTVSGDEWVTAFVYRPEAGVDEPAPLIVRVHGGPTAASYPVYDPLVHWWIQQGFAVADINPRGSGNWGRAFRERLAGEWGRLDVEDVIALADELVEQGIADPERLFVRGQSAGGFTVLNTLATTRRFRAGASLYGVTDAPRLAAQTHRFESGYLGWLLGDRETQRARSPRYRVDEMATPVIFFQGEQDRVVVPEQTHAMAAALRQRGVDAAVVMFDDEGHGIRHPANRQRMILDELTFFSVAARLAG